jgi:hypothetical protein
MRQKARPTGGPFAFFWRQCHPVAQKPGRIARPDMKRVKAKMTLHGTTGQSRPDVIDRPQTVSPAFEEVRKALAAFRLADFNAPDRVSAYVAAFGLQALTRKLEADRIAKLSSDLDHAVNAREQQPFEPDFSDLCRLHWLVLTRCAVNVLEFGSGFSTAVMADAMRLLHGHFAPWARANLRHDRPFHVYAVEEEQRFLELSQARLGDGLRNHASISRSSVDLGSHDGRHVTFYTQLPNIMPDLIYLDGPSQYATTAEAGGFSLASPVRMPMSGDILRFEYFLEPGCLILVDGRTQNARFLRDFFRRNWAYMHDPLGDVHYFELQEEPLGPINRRRLDFCLGGGWLLPA